MGKLNQPRINSYETAANYYESIKPTPQGYRPVGTRSRIWEHIIKGDNEYVLTDRRIGIQRNISREIKLISHTPDAMTVYHPAQLKLGAVSTLVCSRYVSSSTLVFLDRCLPCGMSAVRYDGKIYIQIEPQGKFGFRQYLLPRRYEGIRFISKRGIWYCTNPVQEVKRSVSRSKKKAWMQTDGTQLISDIEALLPLVTAENYRMPYYVIRYPFQIFIEAAKESAWKAAVYIKENNQSTNVAKLVNKYAAQIGETWDETFIPIGTVGRTSRYSDLNPNTIISKK